MAQDRTEMAQERVGKPRGLHSLEIGSKGSIVIIGVAVEHLLTSTLVPLGRQHYAPCLQESLQREEATPR